MWDVMGEVRRGGAWDATARVWDAMGRVCGMGEARRQEFKSQVSKYQDSVLNGPCMHHAWTMRGIKAPHSYRLAGAPPILVNKLFNKMFNT